MTLGGLIIICGTVIIVSAIVATAVEKCNLNKCLNESYKAFRDNYIEEENE